MKKTFLGILLTAACLGSLPQPVVAKEQPNTRQTAAIVSNVPVSASGKVLPPLPKINKGQAATTNEAAASEVSSRQKSSKLEQDKKASKKKANKDKKSTKQKNNTKATAASDWRTKVAQQKLLLLGYSNAKPTGRMTDETAAALKKFQKDNDLKGSGKLDDETYRKLNWRAFTKEGIDRVDGKDIIKAAEKHKGVPYVFGGTTPKGFDCSGYVQYVFQKEKASLPRTADAQALLGIFVTQKQLKPGDLVFFTTYEAGASHVGIYAGNGKFWSATTSKGVALVSLQDSYWKERYYGARRILITNGEAK